MEWILAYAKQEGETEGGKENKSAKKAEDELVPYPLLERVREATSEFLQLTIPTAGNKL